MTIEQKRLELHEMLCGILGSRNVYYQAPTNLKINYPAIIYKLDDVKSDKADNRYYIQKRIFTVTHIDKSPVSDVVDALLMNPYCEYDRGYVSDNLNHNVFSVYY